MKFFNLNLDILLGGDKASDYEIASQKAVKTYVDNKISDVLPNTEGKGGKYLKINNETNALEWDSIDSSHTYTRDTYIVGSSDTNPPSYSVDTNTTAVQVYLDGVLSVEGTTYTFSNYTVTFNDALPINSQVDIISYCPFDVAVLPVSSNTSLGVVKVGDGLNVDSSGVVSCPAISDLMAAMEELKEKYESS